MEKLIDNILRVGNLIHHTSSNMNSNNITQNIFYSPITMINHKPTITKKKGYLPKPRSFQSDNFNK